MPSSLERWVSIGIFQAIVAILQTVYLIQLLQVAGSCVCVCVCVCVCFGLGTAVTVFG